METGKHLYGVGLSSGEAESPAWCRLKSSQGRSSMTAQNPSFQLEVLVHGKPVRFYHHEGNDFIEGRKGSEFTLRVHNKSPRRVEAVISVEGIVGESSARDVLEMIEGLK